MAFYNNNCRPSAFERHLQNRELHRKKSHLPTNPRIQNNPLEIHPKNINVSAGGRFYEKAKSRNNRAKEVFRHNPEGQALVRDAVPLGRGVIKRTNSNSDGVESHRRRGRHLRELSPAAMAMMSEGQKAMRKRLKVAENLGAIPELPILNESSGSHDVDLIDITSIDSDEGQQPADGHTSDVVANFDSSQNTISLSELCDRNSPDLTILSNFLDSRNGIKACNSPLNSTWSTALDDANLAVWNCCLGKRSSRHLAALVLLLSHGADVNAVFDIQDSSCSTGTNHGIKMEPGRSVLDFLYEATVNADASYKKKEEGFEIVDKSIDQMVKVLVSFGAKFHKYVKSNDAICWLEALKC